MARRATGGVAGPCIVEESGPERPEYLTREQGMYPSNFPIEGDLVLLYGSRDIIVPCVLKKGGVCRTRLGNFEHADIMRTPIGRKVQDRRSGKWLVVLRPTPDLHTLALRHRTQIIYHADISLIMSLLDVCPGKTIIEAGTGSGSLTFSLAASLRPGGRLFTFEFHKQRWQEARVEFDLLGISTHVEAIHRDVCADGFCQNVEANTAPAPTAPVAGAAQQQCEECLPMPHSADGVFLDLPSPWLAIKHASVVLKGGGRLVTFSPCVEQLHKTLAAAQEHGFQDFQAFEILAKPWGACISRPTPDQRKHQDDIEEGDAFYHLKAEKKSEQGAQGGQVQQPTPFRDLLSHFLQPPSSQPVSSPGSSLLQETEAAAVDVRRKNTLHISSYHYQMPMKGHTGYVAYCVRPSEDEELQPLPKQWASTAPRNCKLLVICYNE
ncbi:tRNA (adenine-N(1)-)-methyltransferase catalytic subunit, putative [Eimeria necatrix]|uniref:tRNA (adenine(58)-N(1))-methyltransferase n=1 Tax=Eimeria necatrix TaxID=51315 RepID=U6MJD1_9EIME|nr:tRNA (adenine-N(1)-)-methyltransferase catalytic subunit, putative [Eimeria necatrix]CDJ64352.1 tRNA (adenine-N(1)-)-methyltransferase catalytic subunit, putative [Eimeria necatrix]